MTYLIVSIANERGSQENAYAKLQKAAACQEAKFAGKFVSLSLFLLVHKEREILDRLPPIFGLITN